MILPNLNSRKNSICEEDFKYHNISTEGVSKEFYKRSKNKTKMILTNSLNHSDL
jgi:hypothetical protein